MLSFLLLLATAEASFPSSKQYAIFAHYGFLLKKLSRHYSFTRPFERPSFSFFDELKIASKDKGSSSDVGGMRVQSSVKARSPITQSVVREDKSVSPVTVQTASVQPPDVSNSVTAVEGQSASETGQSVEQVSENSQPVSDAVEPQPLNKEASHAGSAETSADLHPRENLTSVPRESARGIVIKTPQNNQPEHAKPKEPQPGYASSRIIVKFKSEGPHAVNECAHCLLAKKKKFMGAVSDQSGSLDQINSSLGAVSAKSLFLKGHSSTLSKAKEKQDALVQKAKARGGRIRTARSGSRLPDLTNTYVLQLPEGTDVQKAVEMYRADPHVEYAHPDYRVKASAFPNDPPNDTLYSLLWGMVNTGQTGGTSDADIDAPQAWVLSQGSGIVVAVVDTGVDYTHEDLADNIWINSGEDLNSNGVVDGTDNCPSTNGDFNCVDDDGNGYVDDIRGWDTSYCTAADVLFGFCFPEQEEGNDPMDFDGHGTHVSGTIGGVANNSTGVIGVAPQVQIMPVKGFLDDGSGFISDLANGIIYAATMGAHVINNSWGCVDPCPSNATAESAVDFAYGMGTVVVFSAGNEDEDVSTRSPQNYSKSIVIAATDDDDNAASFSNFGTGVDIAAPGVGIWSSIPGDDYDSYNGTSMACPHAVGVVALILAYHSSSNFSIEQVRTILRETSDDVGLSGYGEGRLNAYEALTLTRVKPAMSAGIDRSVNETQLLQFSVSAVDPNGDAMTLASTLSNGNALSTIGATFTDLGTGSGNFSWTPNSSQGGATYNIKFKATDSDGFIGEDVMTITVNEPVVCGNGVVESGEQCDDGNVAGGDGCSATCQDEICGNNTVDVGEECDDGNTTPLDGCSDLCIDENDCGNSVIEPGEDCDDGNVTDGDGCSALCHTEICGNGFVEFGEECDDGNVTDGDGCTALCVEEVCGDGDVNDSGAEQCDDGNVTNGDGCNSSCINEFCGDGTVNDSGAEQCDDGNLVAGDGCSGSCVIEFCGDNIINNVSEQCDDGNVTTGDGCSDDCLLEVCGNGILDPGETCDDGNLVSGDGCSSDCQDISVCGDKICDLDETCSSCWEDCGRCRGGSRPRPR